MKIIDYGELNSIDAIDAIEIMEDMTNKKLVRAVESSSDARVAELLKEGQGSILNRIIATLTDERLVESFKYMKVDDITDVIGMLKAGSRKILFSKIDNSYAEEIKNLLGYSSDSAGGIMTTEYLVVNENLSILDIYNKLSAIEPSTEVINEIFLVDDNKHLTGKISIRDLFLHDNCTIVKNIMEINPKCVSPYDDNEKVTLIVKKYDLVNVPVVNKNNIILGVITYDDIMNSVYLEQNEEVLNLGGVINKGSLDISIGSSLFRRLPWLLVNLITVFFAAFIISQFDKEIEKFVGLAMAMPIIAGMGGNSGNQVLAVTIRSIALDRLRLSKNWSRIFREIIIGFINGLLLGIIAGTIIYLKYHIMKFSIIIVISMICNFFIANIIGFTVPLILKSIKIDPASGSSVILTAFTDSMGFLIFLSLSRVILSIT